MGKKNSPEAKALRREKVAAKRNAFSNPVERPTDCLRHFGFIPNEDFFKHSAIAWDTPDMKLAMRTKANLIQCREEGLLNECMGRTGEDGFVYLSFFRTGDYEMSKMYGKHSFKIADMSDTEDDIYYIYRPTEWFGSHIGKAPSSKDERAIHLPFMNMGNTIMCPISKLDELPEKGFSDEDNIKWGKVDESVSPLNEKELDILLANSNEVALRENYVFNEDGLVIEEFAGNALWKGETFYQPKKKDEIWKSCFQPFPFKLTSSGIAVGDLDATYKQNNILKTPNN